jgi:diaminopimelate epimerase
MSGHMTSPLKFTKMNGTGNDFIVVDNRDLRIAKSSMAGLAKRLCHRQFSVGADGMIFIEPAAQPRLADFRWQFFNADGSEAEMCGNGARCAARFAFSRGIAQARMQFETIAGLIEAQMVGVNVKIRLTPPSDIVLGRTIEIDGVAREFHSINTGVPHTVHFVEDNTATPVQKWGRLIRHHKLFEPAGTNVNFVQMPDRELHVRTYERGVEDETLACGTGAVASALIAALHGHVTSPVKVRTTGGAELIIHFILLDLAESPESSDARRHEQRIAEVYLEGPASLVYDGELYPEALP